MKKLLTTLLLAWLVTGVFGCSVIEGPILNQMDTTSPVQRAYVIAPSALTVDDVTIGYMEAGEGPWVVMIHGGVIPMNKLTSFEINPLLDILSLSVGYMPIAQSMLHSGAFATADSWNYNIQAIADAGFHVVALDLPGFGLSDKPDIDYTVEEFAAYLAAFMKAKGIGRASLIGHGLGGKVAIQYTLDHPEAVDRLVLVDSFGSYGPRSPLSLPRWAGIRRVQKEKAAKIKIFYPTIKKVLGNWELPQDGAVLISASQKIKNASAKSKRKIIVSREGNSGEFLKSVADYKKQAVTTEDFRGEVRATHLALMETRKRDLAERLGEINVPVLIIRGFYDPAVSDDEASYMDYAIPMSVLATYENSGHYPMVEESDRFNADAVFFLTGKTTAQVQAQ